MTQDVQNIRFQLLNLDRQQKSIQLQRRELLKKLSDPQKNKDKFKIIKFLYQLVLETPVNDELDIQDFIKKILNKVNIIFSLLINMIIFIVIKSCLCILTIMKYK
jgi:hypothetical protein